MHFDLASLTDAALDGAFDEFDAFRDSAAHGLSDPGAVLRARARAYGRFALENPGLYRVMFGVDRPVSERGQASFRTLVQAIEHCGVEEDSVRLAALLWAGLHGLVSLRISRSQFPWPSSLDDDIESMVSAIVGIEA